MQPEENLQIPTELEKAIESVRNNITLGEAEVKRLRTLVDELNAQIEQLNKSKQALNLEVMDLGGEKINSSTKVNDLNNQITELESKKASTQSEIDSATLNIQSREDVLKEKETDYALRLNSLESKEAAFSSDYQDFIKSREDHKVKVDKLNEALK